MRIYTMEKALRSIQVPLLYMPSMTDLYFPIGDARYEAAFMEGEDSVLADASFAKYLHSQR